jgi:hypothetical protein
VALDAVLDDLELDEPDFVELEPGPMFVHLWVVEELELGLELSTAPPNGTNPLCSGRSRLAGTVAVAFVGLCVTLWVARAGDAPATAAPTPAVAPPTATPATRRPSRLNRMVPLFLCLAWSFWPAHRAPAVTTLYRRHLWAS